MASKGCGGCTLCCKVMGVKELTKPRNVWCEHCEKGRGCGVYESRPKSCQDFECVWLQSQTEKVPLPDELRPDRCHAVILPTAEGVGLVLNLDPGYPDAYRQPKLQLLIDAMVKENQPVIIACGNKRTLVGNCDFVLKPDADFMEQE